MYLRITFSLTLSTVAIPCSSIHHFSNKRRDHIKVTITAGLADYSGNDSIDKWVNVADENLYKGKKTGKNKVVY